MLENPRFNDSFIFMTHVYYLLRSNLGSIDSIAPKVLRFIA